MKITRPRAVIIALLFLAAALIAYGFLPDPIEVEVGAATLAGMQITVNEEGRTRVVERYQISAPVSGRLLRVPFKAGDTVESGMVVARIIPAPPAPLDRRRREEAQARVAMARAAIDVATARIQAAETAADFAGSAFARAERLSNQGHISEEELESADQRRALALAELETTRKSLIVAEFDLEMALAAVQWQQESEDEIPHEILLIRAPVSGSILTLYQESEMVVVAGAPILEIGDPNGLEVVIDVLSTDAVRIPVGAPVHLHFWGGENALPARVRRIEPSAFTKISALGVEEQRVNVIADFQADPEDFSRLGNGFRVEARIVVWEEPAVLQVPAGTIFRDGSTWGVFAIENGRATLRRVEVGHSTGLQTQILSGLSEGDRVVRYPSDKLRDGSRVRLRDTR
jgi:HlyD family secretion protein